jgi:hypothetical protein
VSYKGPLVALWGVPTSIFQILHKVERIFFFGVRVCGGFFGGAVGIIAPIALAKNKAAW